MIERIKQIKETAELPMKSNKELRRVEIVIFKYKEEPVIIDECISRIVHNTEHPFTLSIYDNRPNTANFSKIWNQVIRESSYDYICIMDSDAFIPTGITPCWLTRMMETVDETGVSVPMGDNVGGANKSDHAEKYPSYEKASSIWSGFIALYRKDIFDKIGYFDEQFHHFGQDSEFAFRCRKLGGTVFRKDVFAHHIGGASTKKYGDREAEKMYAATLYKMKTNV